MEIIKMNWYQRKNKYNEYWISLVEEQSFRELFPESHHDEIIINIKIKMRKAFNILDN